MMKYVVVDEVVDIIQSSSNSPSIIFFVKFSTEFDRFVDSRVDKLEDKIYKNFDIKQNQSNIY